MKRQYRALVRTAIPLAAMTFASAVAQSSDNWKCNSVLPTISLDERISSCNSLLALDKGGGLNKSRAYTARAKAYLAKGEVDSAIADFSEVVKLYPDSPNSYSFRAYAYYQNGDFDRAIADYSEVIRRNQSDAFALLWRGEVYFENGEPDQAIADFDRALKINPLDRRGYVARGWAYYSKGDFDRAFSEFGQVLRLDPNDGNALFHRAIAYAARDDLDHAIADYGHVIELVPKSARTYRYRALAYLEVGSASKSLADLDQSSELDPKDPYTALWREAVAKRNNLPSRLVAATRDLVMSKWPAPLVHLYLGDMTREAVFAAADDANDNKKRKQLCEANFYAGELALQQGAKDEAGQLFRLAANGCPHNFIEWLGANLELKALASP
jgi:lipoprotein NlpI